MFERFTDGARQAMTHAEEEARELKQPLVDTEHLLLALLRDGDGAAAQALEECGVTHDAVLGVAHVGGGAVEGRMAFAPQAKRVLERSLREALRLEDGFIGTEHVLLGLLREEDTGGYEAIVEVGAEPDAVRSRVLDLRDSTRPERRRGRRPKLGSEAQQALTRARDLAQADGREEVTLDDLRRAVD